MDFIHPKANEYVTHYSNATPAYLKEMYAATLTNHPQAHLQSSWNQGGFLSFISKLINPKYIIEIGSFTGFSSLCLAEGLQSDGQLHTIEIRDADAQTAISYFKASPKAAQIIQHIGDAKTILPTLPHLFDLAFIDADKTGYIEYYTLLLPLMQQNGIIIADNVLFHGDVLEDSLSGKSAKAIQAFNDHILNDISTEKVMLTIRDGLTLIRKK